MARSDLFTMAPKSRMKRKAEAAGQASANVRKKQRVSSEVVDSISAGNDTMSPRLMWLRRQ